MENIPQLDNKGSAKIITDPEKLKKQIKFNGTFGIVLGALIILVAIVTSLISESSIIISGSIVGIIYIILGILIRRNPTKALKPTYVVIGFSLLVSLMSMLLSGGNNSGGLLILIYMGFSVLSIKYIKRLGSQKL